MAVGPQYQSQLALLAGALSHGLDPNQGLDMYQQTIAQAEAAREARKQAQQQTAATLAQLATQSATQGATPEQIGALVKSTAAGLPGGHSPAVHDEIHHILGHLSDYQATPDPMTQLQLQGQQLDNQLKQQQLQAGTQDTSGQLPLFNSQNMQQVQQAVAQYDAQGLDIQSIRNAIYGQLGINPGSGPDHPASPEKPVIDNTISAAYGQLHPGWASTNLQMFGAQPPPPPTPPPPPPPSHLMADVAGGTALGAGIGALGGPFDPITIPTGAAIGALGGLIGHAVYGSLSH